MMKRNLKYMALVLSGSLLLGGCGAGNKQTDKVEFPFPENTIPAQTSNTEDNSAEKESAEKNPGNNKSEQDESDTTQGAENNGSSALGEIIEGSAPEVSIVEDKKVWSTEDKSTQLLEVRKSIVTIENSGFDALQSALQERWNGITGDYQENIDMAREDYNGRAEEDKMFFGGYTITEQPQLARSDSSVISFRVFHGDYSGGAHDNYVYGGVTFDVKTGKELQLVDILNNPEGFYDEAAKYLANRLEEDYNDMLFADYKDYVAGTFGEDREVNWYFNAAGIAISYSPYEIGPYAAGTIEVTLPYSEFSQYIKEEYWAPHSSVVAKVPLNNNISGLIGESGTLKLEAVKNEYELYEVTVVSENASEEIGSFGYFGDAYVIRREDGRSFLLTSSDYMSDDFVMNVYEVTNGGLQKCDELSGAQFGSSGIGTNKVSCTVRLNVLGSYWGEMVYQLDSNGQLSQVDEIFNIQEGSSMTVMKELPVVLEGAESESKVAVGRKLNITGTDNNGTAYFRLDNGEKGKILYTRDEETNQIFIDGESENAYFDMVPYAG